MLGRHQTLCGGADPQGTRVGGWGYGVFGRGCWEGWFGVMGGLQQLVVHDGETERCGGGGGNGTNRGAVFRSARAKEVVQPGGILAVGGGGRVVVVKKNRSDWTGPP